MPPPNGWLDCGEGLQDMAYNGENCTFKCNPGYKLVGNVNGSCTHNGWSNESSNCEPRMCNKKDINKRNAMLPSSCTRQYQSNCTLSCKDGFIGNSVTYMCSSSSNSKKVVWVPIDGIEIMCERGKYMLLPTLQ